MTRSKMPTIRTECVTSNQASFHARSTVRIPELDGVRGLAIFLVLIEHYIRDASQLQLARWEAWVLVPFRFAWSGVDLFFVLSGFLIGGILMDARTANNYYSIFYARRVCRIFPLYFLWFAFFLVGFYLTGGNYAAQTAHRSVVQILFNRDLPILSYPFFVQNVAMSLRGTMGPMWLGITWSLAVEEQFYLLLPLAIRNLTTKGLLRLVCAGIVIAPLLRIVLLSLGCNQLAPYTLLPCRADALGFGVLAAILVRNQRARDWLASHRAQMLSAFLLLGASACLLTKFPFASRIFMGLGFSMLGALYALLLLLVIIRPSRGANAIFRWKPLMGLGTISYAVYLFHPAISYLLHDGILHRFPAFDEWHSIAITGLAVATTVSLAMLSWVAMEGPLTRWAHRRFRYSLDTN